MQPQPDARGSCQVLIRMRHRSIDLFVIEQASACVKIEFKFPSTGSLRS
jgi:hypothetical protein